MPDELGPEISFSVSAYFAWVFDYFWVSPTTFSPTNSYPKKGLKQGVLKKLNGLGTKKRL